MNTASDVTQSAREALKEARDGVREAIRRRGVERHPKRFAGVAGRFRPPRRAGQRYFLH